jgi:autotransporter-associated beta strand protein
MLTLTGANTFTGTLTINEGGIQLGANGNVLSNTGTIKLVGGTLALGAPMETIGTLSITGGTLAFDLTSSTSYERLVASSITLTGGTLRLTLAGGYQPVAGATFDILDWSSKSGTFATLDLPALANGLAWNTSSLYTNGTLSVTAVPEPGTLALVAFSALLLTFSRFVPRRERIRLRQPSRR